MPCEYSLIWFHVSTGGTLTVFSFCTMSNIAHKQKLLLDVTSRLCMGYFTTVKTKVFQNTFMGVL